MKSVILYYFSGSGNTLKVAMHVKETFEKKGYTCAIKKMEDVESVESKQLSAYEYVGLLFPVAIQSTFPLVWDFISGLPTMENQKIFMIDTMEAFSGGVVGPVKKVLEKKGYHCMAALEVKMISSMRIKPVNNSEMNQKNNRALLESEKFIQDMLDGNCHWGRVPVLSDWMRDISLNRKIWTKTSRQLSLNHEKCIKCKICIKNCPTKALSMVDDKIAIDHTLCMSCMRCVHNCPKDAFLWKGQNVVRIKTTEA